MRTKAAWRNKSACSIEQTRSVDFRIGVGETCGGGQSSLGSSLADAATSDELCSGDGVVGVEGKQFGLESLSPMEEQWRDYSTLASRKIIANW